MEGDLIIIGNDQLDGSSQKHTHLLTQYAFSHALCRSSKLAVLESGVSKYLQENADIPAQLARRGSLTKSMTRHSIVQKTGQLLEFRRKLNLELNEDSEDFLATPEAFWSEEALERPS